MWRFPLFDSLSLEVSLGYPYLCVVCRGFFPTLALSSCGNSLAYFGTGTPLDVPSRPESSWPKPNWVEVYDQWKGHFLSSQGSSAYKVFMHVVFSSQGKVNPIWMSCGFFGVFLLKSAWVFDCRGGINAWLQEVDRSDCRDQRVARSGLMAHKLLQLTEGWTNHRMWMWCCAAQQLPSDGFGQQCFSNDFLDILKVTGERARSKPCFGSM